MDEICEMEFGYNISNHIYCIFTIQQMKSRHITYNNIKRIMREEPNVMSYSLIYHIAVWAEKSRHY